MSDPALAVGKNRVYKRLYRIFAATVVPLGLAAYFIFNLNVEVIDIDSLLPHALDSEKAEYFEKNFMTAGQIESDLKDITIVYSSDIGDVKRGLHYYINEVYYVYDHVIIQWGDTDDVTKLATGNWRTAPWLQLLYWKGRVRLVKNHAFCMIMPTNMPPNEPICTIASDIGYLQGLIMPPHTQIRRGDVFSLRNATKPPFLLTAEEPVSFAALLRLLPDPEKR